MEASDGPGVIAGAAATGEPMRSGASLRPIVPPVDPWEVARGVIEHEDSLINHRLTWLLAMQGFLFAAFAIAASPLVTQQLPARSFLWWVILGIALVGVLAPWFVWPSLMAALYHLRHVTNWWIENYTDRAEMDDKRYPRIRGYVWSTGQDGPGRDGTERIGARDTPRKYALARTLEPIFDTTNIPILLSVVWVGLLISVLTYSPLKSGSNKVTVAGPDGKSSVAVEFGNR